MPLFRLLIVYVIAVAAAACASDREAARDSPPTPYAAMTEPGVFGVAEKPGPDGATEIFVRLNETSSAKRARDMAWYHAARLGRARQAETFRVVRDEPGLQCDAAEKSEPGWSAAGDPIALVAVAAFAAVYSVVPRPKSFAGRPTHTMDVIFPGKGTAPREGPSVPVGETLAALRPEFGPEPAKDGAPEPDPARFTKAERKTWARTAEANEKQCAEREEETEQKEKAARGNGPSKAGAREGGRPDAALRTGDVAEGR